jgi:hypothetical protein
LLYNPQSNAIVEYIPRAPSVIPDLPSDLLYPLYIPSPAPVVTANVSVVAVLATIVTLALALIG